MVHEQDVRRGLNSMKDSSNLVEFISPDQSLGSLVTHFPIGDDEKSRINERIAEKGLPRQIIVQYCAQTSLFREEFVKVRIPGFRPVRGQKSLNPATLKAFCDFLRNPRDPAHPLCWHIYRECVIAFVQKDLERLQRLLSDCNYIGEKVSSRELLQEICLNASEFGVKEEDVEKLYECVWFERIDDFADLLPLCRKADPSRVQAKQLRELASTVKSLTQSFEQFKIDERKKTADANVIRNSMPEKLDALSASQNVLAEKIKQVVESSTRNFESQEKSLKKRILEQSSTSTLEKNFSELRAFVDNVLVKTYGERLQGLEVALDQNALVTGKIQDQLKSLENDLLLLIDRADPLTQESCHSIVEEKLAPVLTRQEFIEEILQKTSKVIAPPAGTAMQFRSPLTFPVVAGKMIPNVVKESDFLRYWGQYLLRQNKPFTPEQLVGFHCCFLANNVVIADYDLCTSWLHCLGWERFSMDLVASPAWCEEQDWKDGISHLFTGGKGGEPRVLTLHNYDSGLVDCYLSPTVHLWALKKKNYSEFCKLFLIPVDAMISQSTNILNHVSVTVNDSCEEWSKLQLMKDLGRDFPKTSLQNCVVDTVAVSQWTAGNNINEQAFDSLAIAMRDKLDIKIDSWVYELCSNTIGECGRFFEEGSAIYLGMATHVLPWVRQKYGQDDYEMAKQYSLQFLDIKS